MSRKPPLWVVLRAQARADPRKTVVLIVLALAMVIVYARTFFQASVPQVASGVTSEAVVQPVSAANSGAGAGTPPATTPAARQKPTRPLLTQLLRDPFVVQAGGRPGQEPAVDPKPDSPVGSVTDPVESIRQQAGKLELQSTICGATPLACINGRVLQPGDEIEGFKLERVEPHRAMLRRDGMSVALNMK